MKIRQEKMRREFIKLTTPIIKWMNDLHPHHTIIITSKDAELLEGQITHYTEEFLKD